MKVEKKLSNGITVVLEQLPYVQSAAVGIWVKAGAVDEKTHPGISHYIEHMMFKGTENRTAKEIAEDIDRIGGNINAFTGKESTCYYVKTLATHLDDSIDVLSDMFNNSLFDPEEMEKEKSVVLEEMKMVEDSPEDLGHDLIAEAVFRGGTLGNSIIGTKESVSSITRDDILNYLGRRYTAENMVISIAGNIDENEVIKHLEECFGGLAGGIEVREPVITEFKPEIVNRKKDIEQTHLLFGKKGTALDADDYYSYLLYNSILGGGMSSRLFQNVREDKGLAYSVYSMNSAHVDEGMFVIYAAVGGDKEKEATKAIDEELRRMATEGITEEELDKVKEQNKGHYIFGQESVASRMFSMGKNTLLLGKTFSAEEIMDGINSVCQDDIIRIAKQNEDLSAYSKVKVNKDEE